MISRKIIARGKLFREAFAAAKQALLVSIEEALSWLQSLTLSAKSTVEQLGIRSLALVDGRSVQIFESAVAIVLFYSDGSSYYALKVN